MQLQFKNTDYMFIYMKYNLQKAGISYHCWLDEEDARNQGEEKRVYP